MAIPRICCPKCRKRPLLVSLTLPLRKATMTCDKCGEEYRTNTETVAWCWAVVIGFWVFVSALVGYGIKGIPAVDGLNSLMAFLIETPIAAGLSSIVLTIAAYFFGKMVMAPKLLAESSKKLPKAGVPTEEEIEAELEEAVADAPSRSYRHDRCGEVTTVSDDDFTRMANPFTFVSATYCAGCEKDAALHHLAWADTDENVAEWRSRQRSKAPARVKLVAYLATPLSGFLIGGGIGGLADDPFVLWLGAGMGVFVAISFIMPWAVRKFGGIDYRFVK